VSTSVWGLELGLECWYDIVLVHNVTVIEAGSWLCYLYAGGGVRGGK